MNYPAPLFKKIFSHISIGIAFIIFSTLYHFTLFFLLSGLIIGIFLCLKGFILWVYTHYKFYQMIEATCIESKKEHLYKTQKVIFETEEKEHYSLIFPIKWTIRKQVRYRIFLLNISGDIASPSNKVLAYEKLPCQESGKNTNSSQTQENRNFYR